MKRLFSLFATMLLMSGGTGLVFGQQWDSTGNNLLNGTYNFREILWVTNTNADNALQRVTSRYGTITFDGSGHYNVAGNEWNSDTNQVTGYTPSNTYSISAGGYGFLNRAVDLQRVYGLVSNGVFVGSSTEGLVNNLFIAALKPSTDVTTATFNQNYTLAYTNLTNLSTPNLNQIRDATFQLGPDGAGTLGGAVNATGYIGSSYVATNLSIPGATYSFTSGVGTLNLGAADPNALISGSKLLYVANGGNLVFGGAPNGADMFVGVLTPLSTVPSSVFSNLYFQAGMDVDRSKLPTNAYLNSYFGSFNVASSITSFLGHQRVQTAPDAAYDYTYSDTYTLGSNGSNGSFNDFLGIQRFLSLDGSIQVGFGFKDYLGISVAIKAPSLSGSGVYINPNGVVDAASYSPFTAGIAPGELLTIFGTGLAAAHAEDPTFPNSLGGVSVTINNIPAPIYIADPAGLAVLVPFGIQPLSVADIVVNNNGTSSNHVTAFVTTTSPGIFSGDRNGLGYPAARHTTRADQGIVTPSDPALPGEYLAVFLTGLGPVTPGIDTGALGPINPLSFTTSTFTPSVDGKAAETNFAGIAPVQRGLYQLNVKVPDNANPSTSLVNLFLEVKGPDAVNSQIKIPVGPAATGSAVPAPRSVTATPQFGKRPNPHHSSDSTRSGLGSAPSTVDPSSAGQ